MSVTGTGRKVRKKADDTTSQATGAVEDSTEETPMDDDGEQRGSDGGGSSSSDTLMGELKSAIREAAMEVLKPVARKATTTAAKAAVTHGPSLMKDKVAPKVTGAVADAGGAGAMLKGVADKGGSLTEKLPFIGGGGDDEDSEDGGGGGRAATGTGRGRRLPVQEFVDVAASIDVVYDQFTQFEDWPQFMHRVEKIEQRDETTLMWHENIWGVRRSWESEITDQQPCERIAWRSSGVETVGVVTFHKLADNLTRVYMTMDFQPKGLFEKTASGTRISRRALKSDLMRFKAYVEMRDEATGQWRGQIEDGEVVDEQDREDEGTEATAEDQEETTAEADEELEEDVEEEPEAEADEDVEAEEDEDYEEPSAESEDEDAEEVEEDEEPVAEAEDEDAEEEEDAPRARRRGRFARSTDEDEEYEDEDEDADDEPVAEEEAEEEKPKPKPRRRTRAKSKTA